MILTFEKEPGYLIRGCKDCKHYYAGKMDICERYKSRIILSEKMCTFGEKIEI